MRKTKIICTLGPATDRDGMYRKWYECGTLEFFAWQP